MKKNKLSFGLIFAFTVQSYGMSCEDFYKGSTSAKSPWIVSPVVGESNYYVRHLRRQSKSEPRKVETSVASARSGSQVKTKPVDRLTELTQEMGFEYNSEIINDMRQSIKDYVLTASLSQLSQDLGGYNGLSGNPKNPHAGDDIVRDNSKTPEQKKQAFLDRIMQRFNRGDYEVLQMIRGVNRLESKYGFKALWTAVFQNSFFRPDQVVDVRRLESFDGLIYRVTENGSLMVIHRGYFEGLASENYAQQALNLISQANGGKPVVVTSLNVQIIPDKNDYIPGRGRWGGFTAEVKLYKNGDEVPEGAKVVQGKLLLPDIAGQKVIDSMKVNDNKDEISLSRISPNQWILRVQTGYQWASRVQLEKNMSPKDLVSVLDAAAIDTGIDPGVVSERTSRSTKDDTVISIPEHFGREKLIAFEGNLVKRLIELSDPIAARRSRLSSSRIGVSDTVANDSKVSGFDSLEFAAKALGFDLSRAARRSTYPILRHSENSGQVRLTIDDRIYSDGSLNVIDRNAILRARVNPMTAVQVQQGAVIVKAEDRKAPLRSGFIEEYFIFANIERANHFIETNRYVLKR